MAAPGTIDQVLEAIPDGLALIARDGRIERANRALSALVGAAVEGRSVLEITRNAAAGDAALAALGGTPRRLELTLPWTRRTLELQFAPLGDGALLSARDVTDAKRMEAARRDFVANASHELRTPVTAIHGAAETLLDGAMNDPASARSFVQMIARHAQRLSQLTQSLLDLSRIESGDWRVDLKPVEIPALVKEAVELARPASLEQLTQLEQEVAPGLRALADWRALEQVVVNLVENAIKHTPKGSRVRVVGAKVGDEVEIAIVDNGPGIQQHHLPRLFERFYRVDPGRAREAGGTGIGLSIVKHLVEAQGGTVGVASDPSGSRFWIRLRAA